MFKKQKTKGRSPGAHPIPNGYSKMIQWCWDNNIAIAVAPDWDRSNEYWKVEIRVNKKLHVDPNSYPCEEAYNKMYNYYKYYYDKYNKQ